MYDMRGGQARQFTFSSKSENSPRWSPDGQTLAFLSDRQDRMQIYLLPNDGGEARPLTEGKSAVRSFRWSPGGRQIAYLASPPPTDVDESKDKDKDDAKVADREQDLAQLWLVDPDSKKSRQLSKGSWKIQQFEWASNTELIAVASDQPRQERWDSALFKISITADKLVRFSKPSEPFGELNVSPDGTEIAYVGARDGGPSPHDLFLMPASGSEGRDVTASIDRPVRGVKWQDKNTAIISVADGFRNKLFRVTKEGHMSAIPLDYSNGDYDVTANGTAVYVRLGFDSLPELYVQQPKGAARQVTHLQEGWTDIPLRDAELFRFKSFDGKEIEAALMKPPKTKRRPPLILYVHGGPAGNFSASYSSWAQLLVAHGYEVLMVNPRGSSAYGEEFLKANHNDWGGGDYKDVMAGVEAVLAKGEADPERLGIGGWSYGGYMAEWAITQTNRFKAAVSGAGMFNLASEFGTEVGPAGDEWYFGTPWEHPEHFAHSSPETYIKNARTPTLILQGESDPIDPMGQSTSLYRALKRYNVDTELVTYPREPHGFREEKHQEDVLTRMLSWFDRYLKPQGS